MAGKLPSAQDSSGLIAEINTTPFVDVVLVLLVIFIVTAPALVKQTLGIRLPKSSSAEGSQTETLGVAVSRDGQILLNGALATDEELRRQVQDAITRNPEVQAIIAADEESRHADVVRAIDLIRSAGLFRFALQIEKKEP